MQFGVGGTQTVHQTHHILGLPQIGYLLRGQVYQLVDALVLGGGDAKLLPGFLGSLLIVGGEVAVLPGLFE